MKGLSMNCLKTLSLAAMLVLPLGTMLVLPLGAQSPVIPHKHIYPETTSAQHDLDAAIALAHKEHKRVLVDFGGDWCGDCQVLDIYANQQPNAELLAKYFVKVNINIGHIDTNQAIAARCGVQLRGVPALAVLDGHGKVIFGQHNEFSNMRNMQSADLTAFLEKWKQ
jgi:thiol:disulfide interchange protein